MEKVIRKTSLSPWVLILIVCIAVGCGKVEEAPPDDSFPAGPRTAGKFVGIHEPSGDRTFVLEDSSNVRDFQEQCRQLCSVRMIFFYDESGYFVCRCEPEGTRFMAKYVQAE